MKFAKELEEDLVPEWRAKYFDYKTGKKKVKAVARALKNVNQTPKTPGRQLPSNLLNNTLQSPIRNHTSLHSTSAQTTPEQRISGLTSYGSTKPTLQGTRSSGLGVPSSENESPSRGPGEAVEGSTPMAIPGQEPALETVNETGSIWDSGAITNYGSFVPSPPSRVPPMGPPSLELPDPALSPSDEHFPRHNRAWRHSRFNPNPHITPPASQQLNPNHGDAYQVGKRHTPAISSPLLPKSRHLFKGRRTVSTPGGIAAPSRPSRLRRMFSANGPGSPQSGDVPLEAYREYEMRQAEFLAFLDKELDKIETFYKIREAQAGERLQLLRQQLHEMRDRRLEEIRAGNEADQYARAEQQQATTTTTTTTTTTDSTDQISSGHKRSVSSALRWIQPIENAIGSRNTRIGKVTKSLQQLSSSPVAHAQQGPGQNRPESWRDFSRRPVHSDDVPYSAAKRKLKLALQEFYRGLELLKSYALLNRTAFRKINKKYDKSTKARPVMRYMSEKVNKAWFVQSEVLEGQIVAVEDLYARYFERGNHKVAVGKLRSKSAKAGDYGGSIFRNGLLLASGTVFGLQGLVYGAENLNSRDLAIKTGTSYLLQIYGGYFLALFLFLLFCLDCRIWTKAKINYVFIFEFDSRHNLDWHQLSELPCLLLFLLGLFLWLNFKLPGDHPMFLYWPAVLVALSMVILFLPAPVFYHKSREWWAYSNFRLLLAGIYPVEFRDFFLGDMYCSQTYSMGNIELFFCLHAHGWANPGQCNSTHSRFLGFLTTVPGLWRAFQCLRRYYDTRNAFPHLVNCGKYTFTVLFYMTLSLYRVQEHYGLKALFITCATINAVYCSVWDIAMDWSLCNPYAEHPFLRDVLGYKKPWIYYLAMLLDPILRFNWIFYAIFTGELQHSALLSFFVGFSEVCRRGMWSLFRVENEHCSNVGRFRASRDVPLPYEIEQPFPSSPDHIRPPTEPHPPTSPEQHIRHAATWGAAPFSTDITAASSTLEAQPSPGTLRRRATLTNTPIQRGIARVGTIMGEAHVQDFERRRRPVAPPSSPYHGARGAGEVESSDEEDEEAGVEIGEGGEVRVVEGSAADVEREGNENEVDVGNAQRILRRHPSAVE